MVNRIRELLDIRQLSPTQFADLIGVGRPVISHILSERNKPSLEVVQRVISAFPDVSLSWLMSGTGPMLTGSTPVATAPSTVPTTTLPSASAINTAPATQFQSAAPAEVATTQVAPSLAAPAPIAPVVATVPAPAPLPIVTAIPTAIQPTRLPQPPKFRPATKVASYSEADALANASAPVLSISPVEATLPIAPASTPISGLVALPSASILPMPPAMSVPAASAVAEVPPVAPVYTASMESAAVTPTPIPVPAPVPASPAEALPPTAPNPAAAFSFLGEAGKTIRRIVLFYSDGSFSDYKPEGQ